MPTILVILGWRLFFYANEGKEPIHVHCQKGDIECKYWLDRDYFSIEEAFAYNMSPRDARQIRKIIYELESPKFSIGRLTWPYNIFLFDYVHKKGPKNVREGLK